MSKFLDYDGLLYFWQKLKTIFVAKDGTKQLSTNDFTDALKTKLEGIEAEANKYVHPAYTARTGKPVANAVPGFGDTVTISQITSDATGHVTGMTDRTIKIPATAASTTDPGLMSAADKTKLDDLENYTHPTFTGGSITNSAATISDLSASHTFALPVLTVNTEGHVSSVSSVNLTINAANASSTKAGLMSNEDKTKLDGFSAASAYALKSDITSMYKHKGSVATVDDLPASGMTAGDVYNVTSTGMNYVWTGTEWDALGGIFSINSMTNSDIDTIVAA